MNNINFQELKKGDIIEHKLSKDWLMVIEKDTYYNKVLCRTKSLNLEDFYDFELTYRKQGGEGNKLHKHT